MRISQDIRNYTKENKLDRQEAIEKGMKEKAEELKKSGGSIYQ